LPLRLAADEPVRDARCEPALVVPESVAAFDRRLSGK